MVSNIKILSKTHFFCAFTSVLFLLFGFTPGYALNLIEAYHLALEHDPIYKVAIEEYLAGTENERLFRSSLLPQINVKGSYQWKDIDKDETFPLEPARDKNSKLENGTSEYGITVSQSLFNLNQWHNYKRGKLQSRQAQTRLRAEQLSLVRRVANAYIDVMRAGDNLLLAQELEKSDKNQLEETKKSVELASKNRMNKTRSRNRRDGRDSQREKTLNDVYQAQAVYDASIAKRLKFEDLLGESQDNLFLITGAGEASFETKKTLKYWRLMPDFAPGDLNPTSREAWFRLAVEKSPFLDLVRFDKDIAQESYRSTKGELAPVLSLELAYSDKSSGSHGISNGLEEEFSTGEAGPSIRLNATLPLYSGGRKRSATRKSRHEYSAATRKYDSFIKAVSWQVNTTVRSIHTTRKRIKINRQAVTSSKTALQSLESSYDSGESDINDLLNVRRTYYNTIRELNNARYEYLLSLVELKYLAGTLGKEDIEDLNNYLVKP